MSDEESLRRYVQGKSPEAFAELVRRHIGWIHMAAARQVRDVHVAEDVTQAVFVALAKRAETIAKGTALSAWLFRATRFASVHAVRSESRRRRHEQKAAAMRPEASAAMTDAQWEDLAPVLDELVGKLGRKDRHLVLLRFYEGKSFGEIGEATGIPAEAARKRTDRAVGKLRRMMGRRAVTLSVGALSSGLTAKMAWAVPEGLASKALQAASGSAAGRATVIAQGVIHMMLWAKMRIAAAIVLAVVVLAGGAISLVHAEVKHADGRISSRVVAPANPPATSPVAAEVAAVGPKGAFVAAYRAAMAGSEQDFSSHFVDLTPEQIVTVKQLAQLMGAANQLTQAVSQRFGADVERQLSQAIGSGVMLADVSGATETITGDTAEIDMGTAGPGKVPMVKVGQKWLISSEIIRRVNANAVANLAAKVPAIRQAAVDVAAGKYRTIQELQQAMMPLMK